jgi:hypothetical protein
LEYAFINGQLAILVSYLEEHYEQVDGGARIDFRRVEEFDGPNGRPGTGGYRILPLGVGGIWRVDLSTRLDSEVPERRYHHHPNIRNERAQLPDLDDGTPGFKTDVGPRVFDEELSADAWGWIERHLRGLPAVLRERGFSDVEPTVDMDQLIKSLPAIRSAIEASLGT